MRISRRRKKVQPKRNLFFNERIIAPKVLVLDFEGKNLGEMNTAEAIRQAKTQGMDLVLINPKNDPPVAKITDYGQYKYRMEKEERIRKAHQHVTDTKGIRLSLRIGQHDLDIRKKRTLKFLNSGDKVKIEIILRGRENQQKSLGFEIIEKFIESINAEEEVRREQQIESQFNKITTIIAKK
ncbi:MAG: translation initiation factor IF-3 [bacterium]